MSNNVRKFRFLVIFDTYDVVYDWLISLLPPIVLDYLFDDTNFTFSKHPTKS